MTPAIRSRIDGGGAFALPTSSSSSRPLAWGSFSCHSPEPSSLRCRSVMPAAARRMSRVSWYVEVNLPLAQRLAREVRQREPGHRLAA